MDRPPPDSHVVPEWYADATLGEACRHILNRAPTAFAVTRGPEHELIWANAAFGRFVVKGPDAPGYLIAEALDIPELIGLLDRAFSEARTFRDRWIGDFSGEGAPWTCTVWPTASDDGPGPRGLVLELRPSTPTFVRQRDITERLLLGALREKEAADVSDAAQQRAVFLAGAGRRLAESIDEETTRRVVRGLHLPSHAAWCIVDVLEPDGAMRRLPISHPDPAKQAAARKLDNAWAPKAGDGFGAPAVLHGAEPVAVTENVEEVVAIASQGEENLAALRELGIGPLLTVPMVVHDQLLGAITFVGAARYGAYTPEEVRLARELALQSAMALWSAHLYGQAVELRATAEEANQAKREFLRHMSHELRTPLNAIAGYVDILDLGIHGPVTEPQRGDLDRIRMNQRHLLAMINDILSFMHVDSGRLPYEVSEFPAKEALNSALALIEPLIAEKSLRLGDLECDDHIMLRADAERLQQILVNLLTNAVKFTAPGGSVSVGCEATGDTVRITIADTGIGIPPEWLDSIFEPFVQAGRSVSDRRGGVGLGLAISRDLARAMGGDLTVRSTSGEGSRFTLSLPRGS